MNSMVMGYMIVGLYAEPCRMVHSLIGLCVKSQPFRRICLLNSYKIFFSLERERSGDRMDKETIDNQNLSHQYLADHSLYFLLGHLASSMQ